MKDMKKKNIIAEINGSWLDYLNIGKKEYWNINNDIKPQRCIPVKNPLPFD